MTTVLLADDHVPTLVDLTRTLEGADAFTVCGSVRDAAGAVTAAVRHRPDVCLLDIHMPGSGIAAAWEITSRLPATRVAMLTVSREDRDLFAALRAGASGYLLKETSGDELLEAVTAIAAGEVVLSPGLVARVVSEFRDRSPRRRRLSGDQPLTSREWEVLEQLRGGRSTAAIANDLVLSQATVRSHVAGILRKLRVPDRTALLALFDEP